MFQFLVIMVLHLIILNLLHLLKERHLELLHQLQHIRLGLFLCLPLFLLIFLLVLEQLELL